MRSAAQFIQAHSDFLLIAHMSPDGDTIGSCLALHEGLLQLGKTVQTVCEDDVPQIYRFLPNAAWIVPPVQARQSEAVICVDCGALSRAGKCESFFSAAKYTLNIDHHSTNDRFAQDNLVSFVAATGEIICDLLKTLGVTITVDMASNLYAALTTDTGNFAYSNTTPETLRIAANLLETGIDLPYLNRMLFRTIPYHKMRLRALAVMKTELSEYGRLGMSVLTVDDLASINAKPEDVEGIIDSIRDIDTVEIAALLRECANGTVRVALRGKSKVDVSVIALQFDGGGHRLAAGCTLQGPVGDAYETIRLLCARELAASEA